MLLLLLFLPVANLSAQATMENLVQIFNSGVQGMQGNNPAFALAQFEQVIEMADEIGTEDAMDMKRQVIQQIPRLHFQIARTLAQRNDLQGSVDALRDCLAASEKYEDERYPPLAKGMIAQILSIQGNNARNAGDLDKALELYNQAHSYDSTEFRLHLGRVLVYDAQGERAKMLESAENAIKIGSENPDMAENIETIRRTVSISFFNAAQTTMQDGAFTATEQNLLTSIEYGNRSSAVYYQLGLARFRVEQWQSAIEALNEALELSEGDAESNAGIYFHIGRSYEALDNTARACAAYRNALHGEFEEAARFQIENVLNCNG